MPGFFFDHGPSRRRGPGPCAGPAARTIVAVELPSSRTVAPETPLPFNRRLFVLGSLAALAPRSLLAQSRPVRLIVPYAAGGPIDIIGRALAEAVKDTLGVVIVENKPGAGGNLGADLIAKAAPDGFTVGVGAVATHAINPWLFRSIPYDPIRDFTPITLIAQVPNVLVMNSENADRLGIRTLPDLLAYARANPGKLNVGSGGNGSAGHLASEMFNAQAGVSMVHVPYAGGNPAQLALLSGQVDLNFDNLATAAANIRLGKLRAIAVTTTRRSAAMPDVPAIAEVGRAYGLGEFDINTWFGLFGPARLPPEVTSRLHKGFADALESAPLRTRLAAMMAEPAPSTPDQFGSFVKSELAKYESVVKASGAKVD